MNEKINFMRIFKSLFKVSIELIYGAWKISRLPQPIVTIFGSSKIAEDNRFIQLSHDLAHKLLDADISVITGGGPGIMKAATCAIVDEHKKKTKAASLGITVRKLLEIEPIDECIKEYLVIEYFFARKWLLTNFSMAFAVFPGGFGTLDELFGVLTLLQTKIMQGVPVILIGKEYWQPLLDWLERYTLKLGLIDKKDLFLIKITDDIEEAFRWLKEQCEACKRCVMELPDINGGKNE